MFCKQMSTVGLPIKWVLVGLYKDMEPYKQSVLVSWIRRLSMANSCYIRFKAKDKRDLKYFGYMN